MTQKVIDGVLFSKMVYSGVVTLGENKAIVNDLNVFPIPDGDTGDNMHMTISSGYSQISGKDNDSLDQVSSSVAKGMLLGARGNSGVILSRIFAGISKGLKGIDRADVKVFSKALECGVDEAYSAVSNPVEGTILTVFKDGVRYANSQINESTTVNEYFDYFIKELSKSLDRTPDLLDVLKEAGVVDSGGAGFIYIVQGMKNAVDGIETGEVELKNNSSHQTIDIDTFTEDSILEFGYCTEFLLRLQRSKVDIDNFDLDGMINHLNQVGESVVCFRDGTIIKAHVHTKAPGDILNYVQQFGEFLTLKIENMTLQHNETTIENRFEAPKAQKPHEKFGLVSVAMGKGIKEAFFELSCDEVIDGGQSMNPSAEDFIKAFENINADVIFVFPNNGNVILTANQAASLYDKAEVRVIPTKTIGEGYATISQLNLIGEDVDSIISQCEDIISTVITGMVSKANRDANMNGVCITSGDYIGFTNDEVIVDSGNKNEAFVQMAEKLEANNYDIMLVICGCDATDTEKEELENKLKEKYRRTEIVLFDGDQPIYDYIMVLE